MPRFIPLNAKQHRQHGWLRYASYEFASGDPLVPLVADELAHALPVLPMAFRLLEDEGDHKRFELVAVQSLSTNINLFVHPDGRWLGGYIPAFYRSYPFRLLPLPESQDLVLCIDADSGLMLENPADDGEPFFEDEGQLSQPLAKVKEFLEKVEQRRVRTQLAVDVLAQQDLIIPWEINTKASEEGEPVGVKGLYRIDERALNALPVENLAKVRKSGALPVAYAQLFSQHRLPSLSRLYQLRHQLEPSAPDVDELFGNDDDLSFDFDA